MPVTIREVAKRLNLSITTVSRALDGYDDVAEDTRRLVEETAREMGYVPSHFARQLRRKRSDALGFILPSESSLDTDPYFTEFITAMREEASANAYDLLVSSAPPRGEDEQATYQRWAHARRVDGFVINRLRLEDWRVQYLAANDIPFVTLQHIPGESNYAYIEVDGREGVRQLVRKLYALGHRRFAFLGGPSDLVIHLERLAGFKDGLQEEGLPFDLQKVVQGDLTYESGMQLALEILQGPSPPSALLCINDAMASGALEAARRAGLSAGPRLAVTGFDGTRAASHTNPPLTTIDTSIHSVATRLVKLLIRLIRGDPVWEMQQVSTTLILRESSGG